LRKLSVLGTNIRVMGGGGGGGDAEKSNFWHGVGQELLTRRYDHLRAAVKVPDGATIKELDRQLSGEEESTDGPPVEVPIDLLEMSFLMARETPGDSVILATYCYATALEIWELTSDWALVGAVKDKLKDAVAQTEVEQRCPDEFPLVDAVVQLAESLKPAMDVENALNCSCPAGMKESAELVVDRAKGIYKALSHPVVEVDPRKVPNFAECQEFLCNRAEIDRTYFEAITHVAHGTRAYIRGGHGVDERLHRAIASVKEAEDEPVLQGDVYQSELRIHRLNLSALVGAWPRVFVNEAKLVYCYPFAVRSNTPGVLIDPRAVVAAAWKYGPEWHPTREAPVVGKLQLTDMWEGYTPDDDEDEKGLEDGLEANRFAGVAITLPKVKVMTTANRELPYRFAVELRISNLGNHYLRVESYLQDAPIHEVNQGMRRGTAQMGVEKVVMGDDDWDNCSERMSDMAANLIKGFVAHLAQAQTELENLTTRMPQSSEQIVLAARRLSVEDRDRRPVEADIGMVMSAFGASLLLQPVREAAVALEEWVRYPVPAIDGANLLGVHGFDGDFAYRTANTSFGYLPGRPNFLILEYEEAAEFVATLPAPLQGWLEDIRVISRTDSPRPSLRDIDQSKLHSRRILTEARTVLAHLRSPDLCHTAVHRELLDRFFAAAGISRLEDELKVQFEVADAYLAELSANQAKDNDRRQARITMFLGITAGFFGLTSIASMLQLFNAGFNEPKGDQRLEVILVAAVAGAAIVLGVAVMIMTWQRRGRHVE
jgi:hypothetical protein